MIAADRDVVFEHVVVVMDAAKRCGAKRLGVSVKQDGNSHSSSSAADKPKAAAPPTSPSPAAPPTSPSPAAPLTKPKAGSAADKPKSRTATPSAHNWALKTKVCRRSVKHQASALSISVVHVMTRTN